MDEDNNPIIKNTGDINIDATTYFQQETQNITQNGNYIYEQNENGAWHLELKPQDSTEPTDVKINISPPTIITPIQNNGYYKFNGNTLISGTDQDYNININVQKKITINELYQDGGGGGIFNWTNHMHWYTTNQTFTITQYQEYIWIHLDSYNKRWYIEWCSQSKGGYSKTFNAPCYLAIGNYSNGYWLWFRNNNYPGVNLISLYDPLPNLGEGNLSETIMELSTDHFDFEWPRN